MSNIFSGSTYITASNKALTFIRSQMKVLFSTIFQILICGALLAGCNSDKENDNDLIASGTTGSLLWSLCADGTLTISGKGEMADYGSAHLFPWFEYRDKITTLIIGNDVTNVSDRAFLDYSNMTSVTIGNSVTNIGQIAFAGSSGLISVTIPSSITTIGDGAFASCVSLTTLTIHGSAKIGRQAFSSCSSLIEIFIYVKTPQIINENVFERIDKSNCILIVPAGSEDAYRAAEVWRDFIVVSEVIPVTGVLLNNSSMILNICETEQFIFSILPYNATGQGIKWSSSNEAVATVDAQGVVFALSAGQTTITATTIHSNNTASSVVNVTNNVTCTACGFMGNDIVMMPPPIKPFTTRWKLCDGTLTLGGYGIFHFSSISFQNYPPPWQPYIYSITHLVIEEYVESLFGFHFHAGTNLVSVTITNPNTVIGITFPNALREIIFHATIPPQYYIFPSWWEDAFRNVNKTECVLYVPAGSIDAYRAAEGWSDFVNIKEIQITL